MIVNVSVVSVNIKIDELLDWWGLGNIVQSYKPYSIAVDGQKSSSKPGFMNYLQKLNPFSGAPGKSNDYYKSEQKKTFILFEWNI